MMVACTSDPLSPGVEYMPDMYRTPSIEEYVDYGEIQDTINVNLANKLSAKVPPDGTIPFSENRDKARFNFPYPYENSNEGYELAGVELENPIVFTEEVYLQGKEIYTNFCVHCHGEKGLADGSITMKAGGKYPNPTIYKDIVGLTQGKMYHTLTYGKGNMGSHASQITQEERWVVIHYVQTLKDEQFENPFKATPKQEETENNVVE